MATKASGSAVTSPLIKERVVDPYSNAAPYSLFHSPPPSMHREPTRPIDPLLPLTGRYPHEPASGKTAVVGGEDHLSTSPQRVIDEPGELDILPSPAAMSAHHSTPGIDSTGLLPPPLTTVPSSDPSSLSSTPSDVRSGYSPLARSGMTPEHFQRNYPAPYGRDVASERRDPGHPLPTPGQGPHAPEHTWSQLPQASQYSGFGEGKPTAPHHLPPETTSNAPWYGLKASNSTNFPLHRRFSFQPPRGVPGVPLSQDGFPTSPHAVGLFPVMESALPGQLVGSSQTMGRGRSNSLLRLHHHEQQQWRNEIQKLREEQSRQALHLQRLQEEQQTKKFISQRLPVRPLHRLTLSLLDTFRKCNPDFRYESSRNPRRALTNPSKGMLNRGYDNENSDYILYVNDIIGNEEGRKYLIQEPLGAGTFGQVVKCQDLKTQETVAVKVVKNKQAYYNQSLFEVYILKLLNEEYDTQDERHILRLRDAFVFRSHLCLVFECLSLNLYEVIRQNKYQGLSTNLVRVFASQILDCLVVLSEAHIIHCDLKPENILLKSVNSATIKVIDFGSACMENKTVHTYIQSRFYRSPEVLLGLQYNSMIDMWSLGCIVAELAIGLPLFPGSSEYNQVARIVEMLGNPPSYMIETGKQAGLYFERPVDNTGVRQYRLKSMEQYSRETQRTEQPSKTYVKGSSVEEIINSLPLPPKLRTATEIEQERTRRAALVDFISGLLNLNPLKRWTPQQARLHPFITGDNFTGPFSPPVNLPRHPASSSANLVSGFYARHRSIGGFPYAPHGPEKPLPYPGVHLMSRENRHSIAYSSNQVHRGVAPSSIPQSSSQVHTRLNRSRASTLANNLMPSEPIGVAHPHPSEWRSHVPVPGPTLSGYPPTGHATNCMYPPPGATVSPAPSLYQSVLCAQQGHRPDDSNTRRSSLPNFNLDQTRVPPTTQHNGGMGTALRGYPVVSAGMSSIAPSDHDISHPLHHYSVAHHPGATDQGQIPRSDGPSTDTMSAMISDGGFSQPGSSFSPHLTGDTSYPSAAHHHHSPSHQRRRSVRHAHRKSQQYPTTRPSAGNITRLSDEFHKRTRIQDHPPPLTSEGSGGEMQGTPHPGTVSGVTSGFRAGDTSSSLGTQSMFDLRHPPPTVSLDYDGANSNAPPRPSLCNADTGATGGNDYPMYSSTQPKFNQAPPSTYTSREPYIQSNGVPVWESNHSTIPSESVQPIRKYPPGATGHHGSYGTLTVPNSSVVKTANHRSGVNKRWMSRSFDASANEGGTALPSQNGNPVGPGDLKAVAPTQERFSQHYGDNLANTRGNRSGQIQPISGGSTTGYTPQPHKLSHSLAHLPIPPKSPTGMPQSGGYGYAATWGRRRNKHPPSE